jgi:hypothetical protein
MNKFIATIFLATVTRVFCSTYDDRVIAAVIVAEAAGESKVGMICVAEVIRQRAIEYGIRPVQAVLKRHHFSSLNRTTPDRLIHKHERTPEFQYALCVVGWLNSNRLPGYTKMANHFTRKTERPYWARHKRPVAVIGNHAFYRL